MATTNRAKRIASDRLFDAATRFIRCHGGDALVGGPIQIMSWPGDSAFSFTLAIPITGRKPLLPGKK